MVHPNILLIAVDTLRRDHLSCFGYGRPTSPHIDRLAAEGTTFDHCYVNHYPTQPSFTTLYTGLDGIEHQVVRQGRNPLLSPKIPMLADRLRSAGYVTAAVDNLVTLRHGLPGWFSRGFDYYLGFRYEPTEREQATYITDRGLTTLDSIKGNSPFFMLLHYWDPHIPYWPPEKANVFKLSAGTGDGPSLVEEFQRAKDEASSLILRTMMMEKVRSYDYVVSQYDEGIWNVDQEVGRILEHLDHANLTRDTLVVFLSDHGECFGEYGVHFDHAGPADANMRVPLILRLPGEIPAGKRVSEFIDTLDVTATILEAAGVKPSERMLGRGVLGTMKPKPFVVSAEATRQCSWILRTKEWKLVLPVADAKSGELFADLIGQPRKGPTLHDMRDPSREQQEDVAGQNPEITERLTRELTGWLDARLEGRTDPLAAQGPSIPWERMRGFWLNMIAQYDKNSGSYGRANSALADRFGFGPDTHLVSTPSK